MQGNFVSGLVLSNCIGSYYMGRVQSRVLDLQLVNSKQINVEDFEGVSESLEAGRIYQFLLRPTLIESAYSSPKPIPDSLLHNTWQGIVINSVWQTPSHRDIHFQICTREFEERVDENWMLIWTPIGNVLMYPHELANCLSHIPTAGYYLAWRNVNWTLLAVMDHVNLWMPARGS